MGRAEVSVSGFLISLAVASELGFLSGLGTGGGSLLILWLTLVQGMDPRQARSVNLLFFLPGAILATLLRRREGVPFRKIVPAILAGCLSAALFSLLRVDTALLQKLFGALLLAAGARELLYRPREKK